LAPEIEQLKKSQTNFALVLSAIAIASCTRLHFVDLLARLKFSSFRKITSERV
jgi:hypothetical protein